ncbi:MAG: S-formylglutathione hydrolase [Micropepsaceae bacterium]
MSIEVLSTHRTFGGTLSYMRHASVATGTPMRFTAFVPEGSGPFPVLTFLAGLSSTEENFTTKAGAYRAASQAGLMVVAPDTSPRGDDVADDPAYDLGKGAGFYIDATEAPWAPHFRMESYITRDLRAAVNANFPADPARQGVSGHSMGGHGALTLAMKHPHLFKSVSAFAPIVSPMNCPWGEKAFTAYLGANRASWAAHDSAALVAAGKAAPFDDILIDQGLGDSFHESQLKTHLIEEAAASSGAAITVRRREGYDHNYFFIATFIADHIAFHAARL